MPCRSQLQQHSQRVYDLATALGVGPDRRLWRGAALWAPPAAALVLNKVDLLPDGPRRAQLLGLLEERLRGCYGGFDMCYAVSARTGDGVEQLRDWLLAQVWRVAAAHVLQALLTTNPSSSICLFGSAHSPNMLMWRC
jgi:hypothetical protein